MRTLCEEGSEKTKVTLLLTLIDEAVDQNLMNDPGLVVHVILVRVRLFLKKLLNNLLHFTQRSEFKSLFFSVEKNLARKKTPENLELKLILLLSGQYFFQSKEVLLSI